MVLVPLAGTGTRGDQVENARYFASRKAALVLEGRDAEDPAALVKACRSILDDGGRRAEASRAARDVGEKDGANYIALRILKRMDGKAAP
jgi:UDP-N-acetylglucosamine--N-acetylmuramyl-(pentapeptide) pyrophosphoryl-undecaprenol N-acetylglucosamine transferase